MDIVVKGVKPYDGTYPYVPIEDMDRDEVRWVKVLADYMPVTWYDGIRGADPDVMGVLAIVGMLRTGTITHDQVPEVWARLGKANAFESVTVTGASESEEGEDAVPPETRPSESSDSSGPNTMSTSETSPESPPETGTLSLASSASDRETSAA